jgi:hypothetical protein
MTVRGQSVLVTLNAKQVTDLETVAHGFVYAFTFKLLFPCFGTICLLLAGTSHPIF